MSDETKFGDIEFREMPFVSLWEPFLQKAHVALKKLNDVKEYAFWFGGLREDQPFVAVDSQVRLKNSLKDVKNRFVS